MLTGTEIRSRIDRERRPGQQVIKWWRPENDFVDYQLIDNFVEEASSEQLFADFELLDLDQMWSVLAEHIPGRIQRKHLREGEVVVWQRQEEGGKLQELSYPFSAEALMTIFDVETRGNVID